MYTVLGRKVSYSTLDTPTPTSSIRTLVSLVLQERLSTMELSFQVKLILLGPAAVAIKFSGVMGTARVDRVNDET